MPGTALANKGNLTGAWSCAGAPALTFGNITVLFEQGGDVADPKALFTDLAAQPSGGQVETLLGQPAFVKGPDASGGLGEAVVFLGTTRVTVIGNGQATAHDLAAIVSSIDVSSPLN